MKTCIHHWLIKDNNIGICKNCGVTKTFLPFDEIIYGAKTKPKKTKSNFGTLPMSKHPWSSKMQEE